MGSESAQLPDLFSVSGDPGGGTGEGVISGEEKIRQILLDKPVTCNREFYLKIESYLLQLAHASNKLFSLSNSRTRLLAHQVESTYRIINSLNRRFLIADEVGLGKTIEAGLVIKELMCRFNCRRILIACPASLVFQWQNEMQSKFNDSYVIMDRREMRGLLSGRSGLNPWDFHEKIICSIDFIKNKSFQRDLKKVRWDAVVFDEAHRLRRDSGHSTQAYSVAEIIAERTEALLLLSATPFRGKLEELFYLMSLLDRNILGPFRTFYNSFCLEDADLSGLRRKISPVVIRRTKKEVGGFTRRFARTIRFELYDDERELYDRTTSYVIEEFNRALQTENRAVGFVMTVFQKLLDSSSYALGSALRKRMLRLDEALRRADKNRLLVREMESGDYEAILDEEEMEDLCTVIPEKTIAEMRKEISTLGRLVRLSETISANKKGERLLALLKDLKGRGSDRFLIFTQFRTTQEYLSRLLNQFRVVVFNGSMNREEKELAIADFKESGEILISTEAGGEGRNLQFCNILVNYDLPWSPLKIEQRIGRLHRFGQPRDVYIYNFSTRDTVAERVLEVLETKLRLFEESIGPPDVLLGQIEDELRLNALFMEMAAGKRSSRSVDEEVEVRLQLARRSFEKLSQLTVTGRVDFNYDEYYRITLKERRFTNRRIESFANELMKTGGYSLPLGRRLKGGLYPIVKDPVTGEKMNSLGTFDSAMALENEKLEFLAFGHPAIDLMVGHCQSDDFKGHTGIRYVRHRLPFTGMAFYYIATFHSATVTRELIPVAAVLQGDIDGFDLQQAEEELAEQNYTETAEDYTDLWGTVIGQLDLYISRARERVLKIIDDRKIGIMENLDICLDPEMEKIRSSFDARIAELEEKLELQTCQMKWYGKDMRSAITRTKNLISSAVGERERLLSKYNGYLGITVDLELVGAGIIISRS